MKIQNLGHVVLRVRSRARSEAFYHGVLGLPVAARSDKLGMTFFSLGSSHHDLAIAEVGEDAPLAARNQTGLAHVAFKIGDSLDALKQAKADLDAAGLACTAADHVVSKSLLSLRSGRQPHRALCRPVRRLEAGPRDSRIVRAADPVARSLLGPRHSVALIIMIMSATEWRGPSVYLRVGRRNDFSTRSNSSVPRSTRS